MIYGFFNIRKYIYPEKQNFMVTTAEIINIEDARFAAVEVANHAHVISKGNDAADVIKEAQDSGLDFIFMVIPDKDETYIL